MPFYNTWYLVHIKHSFKDRNIYPRTSHDDVSHDIIDLRTVRIMRRAQHARLLRTAARVRRNKKQSAAADVLLACTGTRCISYRKHDI